MEVKATEPEPYNGEESELRDFLGDSAVYTNNTTIYIGDAIKNILKTSQVETEQTEAGIPEEVSMTLYFQMENSLKS